MENNERELHIMKWEKEKPLEVHQFKKKTVNNKKVKKNKKQLIKVAVAFSAGALITVAAGQIYNMAEDAFHRMQGAGYIIEQVNESGILPANLSSYKSSSTGVNFRYLLDNGNIINVEDEADFVAEIFDAGLNAGFSAEEMAVYFEERHEWHGEFQGVTREGKMEAKEVAYEAMLAEAKGVSK